MIENPHITHKTESFATERIRVASQMQQYGGSFVRHLGAALQCADTNNAERIKAIFPEYWLQYSKPFLNEKR